VPPDTPAPRRRLKPEDRRRELLDAAEAMVRAQGAEHLTMKGLADASGVHKALLYHYFSGRDDVLVALHARLRAAMIDEIRASIDTLATSEDKLRAVVRSWLEPTDLGLVLGDLNNQSGPALDQAKAEQYLENAIALSELLADLYGLAPAPALTLAATFMAGTLGFGPAREIVGWSIPQATDAYVAMMASAARDAASATGPPA
jgi:AcrR family transcriptional regulator